MSAALLKLLRKDFTTADEIIKIQMDGKNKFLKGQTNRLFDDFKQMVSDSTLMVLSITFQRFFQKIKFNLQQTDELSKLTFSDRENIKYWVKSVADLACQHLFDPETKAIDQDLLYFLGLLEFSNKVNKADLVCAYIGAVMQQMAQEHGFTEIISEKPIVFSSVCNYLNLIYRQCALQAMKANHIQNNDFLLKNPQHKPFLSATSTKSAIGIGILGGLIGLGFTVFKTYEFIKGKNTDLNHEPLFSR